MRGECELSEEISDLGCMLDGHSCGRNMVFKKISKKIYRTALKNMNCVVICECEDGYREKNNQCVLPEEPSNPVSQHSSKIINYNVVFFRI